MTSQTRTDQMSDTPNTASYPEVRQFIGGMWRPGGDGVAADICDPATGNAIGKLPKASQTDLEDATRAAEAGFEIWRKVPAVERSALLNRAAAILRDEAETNAVTITLENGKTLAEARGEALWCADTFEWFAAEALRAYGRVLPSRTAVSRQLVLQAPIGPVAAFTPWNFPANLVARKVAPALAAGCSIVLKPSEETPAASMALARALQAAGLPDGVFNIVMGDPAFISEHLLRSPVIRKISITSSVPVGRQVARLAGEMLKPCTLELGGHAPAIVFDDVDVDAVARVCAQAKLRNTGQVCTSPTRFLVQEGIYDRFTASMVREMESIVVGPGLDPTSRMGPLANERRVDAMLDLVAKARDAGGKILTGGERIGNIGNFFAPTVIADLPTSAEAMNVEPFGPVALLSTFTTPEQAIAEANRLPYGLAAYAMTGSAQRAMMVSEELEAGGIGINTFSVVPVEAPFGGIKDSGYGYEGGAEGLAGYQHSKFVNHE